MNPSSMFGLFKGSPDWDVAAANFDRAGSLPGFHLARLESGLIDNVEPNEMKHAIRRSRVQTSETVRRGCQGF
jgi:hypothetical protein